MRRMKHRVVLCSCVLAGFSLLNLACNSFVGAGNIPANAPALVVPVIEDSTAFAQTGSETLAGVVLGTVIDDLSGLSGCYGAYYVAYDFGFFFSGYEVYSFDATTGQGRYAVLQGAFAGVEHSFTFTVTGGDRIRIRRELVGGTVQESDALVTLSGTELKIAWIARDGNLLDGTVGEEGDERVGLVFRQFACP